MFLETAVTVIIACTNDNWEHSERCNAPVDINTLELTETGYDGMLLSGVYFQQSQLVPGLQKFTMEDVFWYIDHLGRFEANSDVHVPSRMITYPLVDRRFSWHAGF